jgi:hypothetical protein
MGIANKTVSIIQEIIIEPILLAFGIFVIFPHWQTIYNETIYGLNINLPKLWIALTGDIMNYLAPYLLFGIVFLGWILIKVFRFYYESKKETEEKELIKAIRKLTEAIDNKKDTTKNT